ncbi:DUF1501 domain-containing protein [Parvularcula lutaonensis]|uniref:DUF1501 domain-containing protein n=1 Tax=Parvularcula lutaonensis TaxID=491923 RepID=A0ABV7MEJ9_9PROT|nr:DUF1501 domain-containing protein [Parvularcula lutaonensis]GGY55691.1 hypothetical protein GCM10007148_27000 [Parvularcula lutaonensis]
MRLSRRNFLKTATASAAATGVSSALLNFTAARAANTAGYKALVCVFLFGGMDQNDTVFSFDQPTYDQLVQTRQSLFDQYQGARDRQFLQPLTLSNQASFGAREFALAPEMPGLRGLFNQGKAAIIGNVGPLIQPTTEQQFFDNSVPLPARLFSHNDQQSTWQASAPEGAQLGWGGLFADAAMASGLGQAAQFSTITTGGNELFLTGNQVFPFQVSSSGPAEFFALKDAAMRRNEPGGEEYYQVLRRHFTGLDFQSSNLIARDIKSAFEATVVNNETYNAARGTVDRVSTSFPAGKLGSDLKAIAETIAIRGVLNVSRQVFFVGIGGFDTHSAQAQDLPGLQGQIDGAIVAFQAAMEELGVDQDVTLFTASDFGRTLAVNGDGTDHGWASNHFVVGGAVNGGRILGDIPEPVLGTEFQPEAGRFVPSVSVEEMAAPMGRWFGLTDAELNAALPNLANFAGRPALNFLDPDPLST